MRFFEEIANRESRNENEIVLYPEGLFYKAYDRSAFACVNRIPTFKASRKRIKYCARELASIGFPASALPKYFPTAPRPLPDGRVVIQLKDRIDADACNVWKSRLPLRERRPRGSSKLKAYLPLAGRDGRTGNLFVHPADLLPDAPVAFSTGTTGAEQPVRTTGGRGAVEQPETRNGGPERSGLTTGEKGAVELRRDPGTREAEARKPAVDLKKPKWRVWLACKMLGISELAEIPARTALLEAAEAARTREAANLAGTVPAQADPRTPEALPGPARTLPRQAPDEEPDPRREAREARIARLIREFRLEASTPVECLLFVADLKKEIDGYL